MKRFWTEATLREADGGWRVWLDERPVKTRCGSPQVAPTQALGEVLRAEWANAPDEVQPDHFPMRDLADRALDTLSIERESACSASLTATRSAIARSPMKRSRVVRPRCGSRS